MVLSTLRRREDGTAEGARVSHHFTRDNRHPVLVSEMVVERGQAGELPATKLRTVDRSTNECSNPNLRKPWDIPAFL